MARRNRATFRMSGIRQFHINLGRATENMRTGAREGLLDAGNNLRNRILEKMNEPKTGNVYNVPGTNREYTASAPGEAPAVATGRLAGSIQALPEPGGLAVEVGVHDLTDVNYAAALELEMDRPYLQPSFDETEEENKRLIRAAIRRRSRT